MIRKPTRLADVTEVITKGTTPTTLGYEFANTGVPFLRVQNIDGGNVNYERDTLFIDERTHGALKRSQIRPGDVLVSIAGTIGRSGLVPNDAPPLNCNQAVAIVRPTEQIFRPFLRLWLGSLDAQKQMRGASVTGTISNLSLTQVGDLEIPLPPLAEQRCIAEVLDRAEALRAKRRAALGQLDSLTQSLFLDLFGDPVANSKRWPIRTLDELGNGRGAIVDGPFGSAINVKEDYIENGEIPVIRTKNVRPFEFITDDLKRISRVKFRGLERSAVLPGDIILTKVGTIGNVCFFPASFEVGVLSTTGSCRIRANEGIIRRMYLAHFLHLYRSEMMKLVAEGVQPFLNMSHIKSFRVPVPDLDLQDEFARRVGAVEKVKTAHRASLAELDALFASLQHRAFRGEL